MKLLVHLHVYYHDQLPWFLERLAGIGGCDWDLAVTWSGTHPESEEMLRSFRSDAMMLPVENAGYDIWPFLKVLSTVDLSAYAWVLKLHTKRIDNHVDRINGIRLRGTQWRDLLVNPLLEGPAQFRKVFALLQEKEDAGMVCSGFLIRRCSPFLTEDGRALEDELERIGMKAKERKFCAGAMFLSRMEPFRRLAFLGLTAEDFGASAASHRTGTLAHVYERILGIAVLSCGYRILPAPYRRGAYCLWKAGRCIGEGLKRILALNRSHIDGRKYLTLLGFTFPLK